jgi:Zn-dependent peptidase ImmA (M78 family)/DNA-binding XRE family transcriptional regulator
MNINGDMLRLARQRRGFQQTEAASRLGIDQSLLSRFENGLVEVKDDFAEKAALVYGFPSSFFWQRDPVYGAPVSVHPMWRKKADVSGRDLDSVVAELNIRVMHLRRFLQGAEVENTSDLPRMDIEEYESPEKIAALVRAHWRVPSGPLKNLISLVEKAGVMVADSSLGGASISGVTFSVPGMAPLIVLNSDQPADRRRFTLAHELAHMIMHRFPTPNMEQEANEFAVALLMPAADIRPYFVGKKIDLSTLAALKPEWRVSMAALLMRAHKLKFLSDNQHTYLWKQISARGYRLREPPELDFEPERPELLQQIIQLHFNALGYTHEELAAFLNVRPSELLDLYGIGDTGGTQRKFTIVK